MRYDGWRKLLEEGDWVVVYHPPPKWGDKEIHKEYIIVIICKKHRSDTICLCGPAPEELVNKIDFLRKVLRYP